MTTGLRNMTTGDDAIVPLAGGSAGVAVAGEGARERPSLPLRAAWQALKAQIKRPFYALYLRRLRAKATQWRRPRHLGLIMDGNRRFARAAGWIDSSHGHRAGAAKLQEVLEWCYQADIEVVTVWCFSLENFQRSTAEVESLLRLFENKTRELVEGETIHEHRVRVRYIGKLELLPESLRREIRRVEDATSRYDAFQLNIAMAYGGREEIADAFRRHIRERHEAGEPLESIVAGLDVGAIDRYLYTSGLPEPDLILRTSGELRMSGFLLWQSAYSELYFCDANWPAFREIDFLRALRSYDQRHRRYGR